jgi:hypothetical protein
MAFPKLFNWLNRRWHRLNCPSMLCAHRPASPANVALYRRGDTLLTCEVCRNTYLSSSWRQQGDNITVHEKATAAMHDRT